MLNRTEQAALLGELAATAELLGQAITPAAAALMAADLSIYPLAVLRRALARVRSEHTGKLTPKAIMDRLESLVGRLSPNEAWAVALASRDEAATVVWTDEIQDAWSQAREVALMRDKVGARMAFIAAYERITAQAREQRKLPVPLVSIGWDAQLRAAALERAVAAGLLTHDHARQYDETLALPAPAFNPLALLTSDPMVVDAGVPPATSRKLAELRDEFAKRASRFTPSQVLQRAERMRLKKLKADSAAAVDAFVKRGG